MRIAPALTLAVALALMATPSAAQTATNPIRYTWIATSVNDWPTAASALVAANGDGTVIALPTGRPAQPWVLLRRVEEGSIYVPEDEPHHCEVFHTAGPALARYSTLDGCHQPTLLTAPDGSRLVVSLRHCPNETRRRPVAH